jgi:hypothetical protein
MRRERLAGTRSIHQREEFTQTSKKYGLYRGVVENCADPLAMGRVQVRVPNLHGLLLDGQPSATHQFIPSEALPWAQCLIFGFMGYDTGSQMPISCGTMVIVLFEGGDPSFPVILGCLHHNPTNPDLPLFQAPDDGWPNYPVPMGIGSTFVPGPTLPSETALTHRHSATRSALAKSLKGHTIWFDDRDDAECMEILDRSGQGMRMDSYVDLSGNKKNKSRRNIYSVFTQAKSPVKSRASRILIRESSGSNELRLETLSKVEKSKLISGSVEVELQGDIGRLVAGNIVGDQVLDIDSTTKMTRLRADKIIIDGEVHFKGKVFFESNVEFYKLLYSHVRAIVNEINLDDPKDLIQTGS